MRSARLNSVQTAAVFSDADANALHVKMVLSEERTEPANCESQADEAHRIGPAASSQSYLLGDKILALAKEIGAQVSHAPS